MQLFFVLSGFLITTILISEKEYPISYYLKRFYWRRSLRIFPLYYLYIALVGIVYSVSLIPENYQSYLPYLLSYTFNFMPLIRPFEFDIAFTHFWSLAVEEQFYLLWPLMIFVLNNRQIKFLLITIIIGCPIFRYFIHEWLVINEYEQVGEIIYRLTPSQLDGFAFGALIPVFGLSYRQANYNTPLVIGLSVFFSLGFWNLLTSDHGLTSFGYAIGETHNFQHIWSYSIVNGVSVLLILQVMNSNGLLNRFFSNKALVQIGRVSYGMYVYHWIILAFFRTTVSIYFPNRWVSFIIYFILVYIISYLSFVFFEKYFIQLKSAKFSRALNEQR